MRGNELVRRGRIIDALHECAGYRLKARALVAAAFLERLIGDEGAPLGLRLRAAEGLLNRVGLGTLQKVEVTHVDRTGAELMERIRFLAAKHGLDVEKLLEGKGRGGHVSGSIAGSGCGVAAGVAGSEADVGGAVIEGGAGGGDEV
jgi:hypothetical protein